MEKLNLKQADLQFSYHNFEYLCVKFIKNNIILPSFWTKNVHDKKTNLNIKEKPTERTPVNRTSRMFGIESTVRIRNYCSDSELLLQA